jgi:hypothetical protein
VGGEPFTKKSPPKKIKVFSQKIKVFERVWENFFKKVFPRNNENKES